VRRALKQPGDSARHDDHLHVRVYCTPSDRRLGCVDLGPMDLLAAHDADAAAPDAAAVDLVAAAPAALSDL
jgi:penicillin-insensitive murein endopeptidase